MRRQLFVTIVFAILALTATGCKKDIDPEIVSGLIFVNQTEYSVTVTLQGSYMRSEVISVTIPAKSNHDGKIIVFATHFPVLQSCTFKFEDGNTIEYVKEEDESRYTFGNPIWLGSYSFRDNPDIYPPGEYYYFTITEDHYHLAE